MSEDSKGRKRVLHRNHLFQCDFLPIEEPQLPKPKRLLSRKKRNDRLNQKDKIAEQAHSDHTQAATVSEGHSTSSADEVVFTLNPEAPPFKPLGNGSVEETGYVPGKTEPEVVVKRNLLWKAVENMTLRLVVKVIPTMMLDQILSIVALIQRDQQSVPDP